MTDDNNQIDNDEFPTLEIKKINNNVSAEILDSDSKFVRKSKELFNALQSDDSISLTIKDGVATFTIE